MSVCGVACLLACTVTLLFRLHCFLKKPQGHLLAVSATNRYACGASVAYNNIRCGLQHRLCGQPKASARYSFFNAQNVACRDGEEEVLESYLSEQAPETKMSLSLLAGGVMSSGALALCWLTGSDPWGE